LAHANECSKATEPPLSEASGREQEIVSPVTVSSATVEVREAENSRVMAAVVFLVAEVPMAVTVEGTGAAGALIAMQVVSLAAEALVLMVAEDDADKKFKKDAMT
jgi:hypothetical protein